MTVSLEFGFKSCLRQPGEDAAQVRASESGLPVLSSKVAQRVPQRLWRKLNLHQGDKFSHPCALPELPSSVTSGNTPEDFSFLVCEMRLSKDD